MDIDGKHASKLVANEFRDCKPIGYSVHMGRMLVYFDVDMEGYIGYADSGGCRIGYQTDFDEKAIANSDKNVVANIEIIRRKPNKRFRKRPIRKLK